MRTLLALLLLLPGIAHAQSVGAKNTMRPQQIARAAPMGDVVICLVPDIQNQTSGTDSIATSSQTSCELDPPYCPNAGCNTSRLCSGSWWLTNQRLLLNQAYSLTGQWDKIDYTEIDGVDNVVSKRPNGFDHKRCDVVIGLGDNMDTADGLTYAQLSADMLREYESSKAFWTIISASGIPWIAARGNHEGEGVFDTLMTSVGMYTQSSIYAVHSERDQIAIKFTSDAGVQICVITLDYLEIPAEAGSEQTASEVAWITSTAVGCGADLPTILACHDCSSLDGFLLPTITNLLNNAANDEIFMVAGGHHTPFPSESSKESVLNVGGKSVIAVYSNWQETARHNVNSTGEGYSVDDGNGGAYTVFMIYPAADKICGHDWNPYWQTTTGDGNGQYPGFASTSRACFDFDWCTRYGGC